MTRDSYSFIYLTGGGGGGERDMAAFADGLGYPVRFETIRYPGWQRYLEEGFSTDTLVEELAAEIVRRVPAGPIRIMGMSIGGHFGYASALRLQKMGREVELFCAIDSFMISSRPTPGWHVRALSDAFDLLKKGRTRDFARLVRSKAWRAVLRLAGGRLAGTMRKSAGHGKLPAVFSGNAVAEQELSMRLLLREAAPWFAELDRSPVALMAPAILLRSRSSAIHDAAWRRRCPDIAIREVPGKHQTLFEPENIGALREAFSEAWAAQRALEDVKLEPAGGRLA